MAEENSKADLKRESRMGPYSSPLAKLSTDLRLLKELNEELQKYVVEMERKRREILSDKFASDKDSHEELTRFSKTLLQRISDAKEPEEFWYPMSRKAIDLFLEATRALIFPKHYTIFIRDMSLVYLVAEFESFLQEVLRLAFEKRPEIVISSKKNITYEQLFKLKDIDEAREEVVEKELLSVVNQDVDGVEKYFEQKFGIQLSALTDWKKFKERFHRRNIIVHNSGIVNSIYRSKTGYKGETIKLEVTEKYLGRSIDMFEFVSSKIAEYFAEKFG